MIISEFIPDQAISKSDQSRGGYSKVKSGERNSGSQTSAQIVDRISAKHLQTESTRQKEKALKKGYDFGNPNITRSEIDLSVNKPLSSSNKHKNSNFKSNEDYTVEVSELEADSHIGCTAQDSDESTADKSQLLSQVEKKSDGLKCNEVGIFSPMDKSELQLRILLQAIIAERKFQEPINPDLPQSQTLTTPILKKSGILKGPTTPKANKRVSFSGVRRVRYFLSPEKMQWADSGNVMAKTKNSGINESGTNSVTELVRENGSGASENRQNHRIYTGPEANADTGASRTRIETKNGKKSDSA
ncbi:unnamed protein product [Hymenolepis diminuta]|uniref:Uncharacterized protein n=1 Tax=Hymenolepis diminuta TaxID=6216 RepID=A0A0R3SAZ5_HYMDI|nr:unnamed protein product [Hymenolepis diminuta]